MTPMNKQMKTFNSNTCRIPFTTCLSALCIIALSTQGATITVTNTNDNGSGSLRQALTDAANFDTINFNSSLNGQTIMLTNGELVVDKHIIISGPDNNRVTVDANHASRVFRILPERDVTISGLTVANGSAPLPYRWGGGIYNDHGGLTLNNCTISGN